MRFEEFWGNVTGDAGSWEGRGSSPVNHFMARLTRYLFHSHAHAGTHTHTNTLVSGHPALDACRESLTVVLVSHGNKTKGGQKISTLAGTHCDTRVIKPLATNFFLPGPSELLTIALIEFNGVFHANQSSLHSFFKCIFVFYFILKWTHYLLIAGGNPYP